MTEHAPDPTAAAPVDPCIGEEQLVPVRGAELCVQTIGDAADPAVVLVAGMSGSMLTWPDGFCLRLAAGGRSVVRFDQRDTGRATAYPVGAPTYTSDDLVADVVGLLDVLDLDRVHLVGLSMGGGIGQRIALEHPDRLRTLTLVATSDGDATGLPGPAPSLLAHLAASASTDRDDLDDLDRIVEEERRYAGTLPFDTAARTQLAARIVDRTRDPRANAVNHDVVLAAPTGTSTRPLREIAVPTLVLHGTADPLFPFPHGVHLADTIPGATLVALEGAGHELPPAVWDVAVEALLDHTAPR